MPDLGGGGQQGSWLEREKEGSARGRGRGTLYLSPSQMAGHPCWAGHPQVWMPGEGCNPCVPTMRTQVCSVSTKSGAKCLTSQEDC